MFKSFCISFRLKNVYRVNSIIYSLKQLPLIKKILPSSLYNNKGIKIANELEKDLEIEKLYLSVENKFDLLYRNNRLDNKDSMFRIIIILLLVLIIIGTINLGNWIG